MRRNWAITDYNKNTLTLRGQNKVKSVVYFIKAWLSVLSSGFKEDLEDNDGYSPLKEESDFSNKDKESKPYLSKAKLIAILANTELLKLIKYSKNIIFRVKQSFLKGLTGFKIKNE